MTTAKTITNAWLHRTLPDIFYEEPGPIEEGMRQEHSIDIIKRCLWDRYEGRPDVFVSNNYCAATSSSSPAAGN